MPTPNPSGLSDEEFAGMRLAMIDELAQQQKRFTQAMAGQSAAESRTAKAKAAKRPGKVKETRMGKSVKEKAGASAVVGAPAGTLPGPDGDGTPLWELPPQELRARLDAQLWPAEAPGAPGAWVPRPPMTLSDYLENGA